MQSRLLQKILLFVSIFWAGAAGAETIAIIGTGDVAGALGPEFAAQGHTIIYGSRNPDRKEARTLVGKTGQGASVMSPGDAAQAAEIVVLAVPGTLVGDIVKGLGDLSGKIIIDPTNPLKRELTKFHHAVDSSNGEIIQAIAPEADVVKAFNTLGWKTMIDPATAGGPVSIPLAGNSPEAKATVSNLVTGMGLEPIDVGGIEHAHWLEGMAILLLNNRFGARDSFDFHLRKNN